MQKIILTNMTLLRKDDEILILNRKKKDWPGLTLPGGKVKDGEDIKKSAIREFQEETGLILLELDFVDYIEWMIENERHLCMLFKSSSYKGTLKDSEEGKVSFMKIDQLCQNDFSTDFDKILVKYGIGGKLNV